MQQQHVTSRMWLYRALVEKHGSRLARLLNGSLVILIFLNVIMVVLESESSIHALHPHSFFIFESFSVAVFTLEYLVRVWVCVEGEPQHRHPIKGRLRYLFSPMALMDFIAILPFYLGLFGGVDNLLVLRSLRLLRVFKLTRYSHSMELLLTVFRQESETMASALFLLCVLILLAATGVYLLEGQAYPEAFGSIPRALWWSVVTLMTVGYGDVVPHTFVGKLFSGSIMVTGVAVAALPAAILASGLINELERRRERFHTELLRLMEEGLPDFSELRHIEQLRIQIGISRTDARLIFEEVKRESRLYTHLKCPHCEQPLLIRHPTGQIHVRPVKRQR
ncbi:MAG: hypothetical protein RI964_895 [Pseudomonadota bacterium]|jgi:voltage-gated potassium channel